MADFTPELASEIQTTCQEGAGEAAEAFGRAWDGEFSLAVGEPATVSADTSPEIWNGPGLVITFQLGDSSALLLLPEAGELLPQWYVEPDETGRSKLATLAQELGHVILPEAFAPDDASAARVKDLSAAFKRAEPMGDVGCLPLVLTSGEKTLETSLVWPFPSLSTTLEESTAEESIPETTASAAARVATDSTESTPEPAGLQQEGANPPASTTPPKSRIQYEDVEDGIRQLPRYAQSLLKVRIPVTVTLAAAKHPVSQILELGPGSIIQFDKSCEDNLALEVGDLPIAEGEAVKIGDKFGLWITSMTMPDERFWVIHGRRSGVRVK